MTSKPPSVDDRVLIRELFNRFYWAFETSDREALKALFAPGGHMVLDNGNIQTPDEVADIADESKAHPVDSTRQHHVTGIIIDPDKDGHEDRCCAIAYFLVTEKVSAESYAVRWSCYSRDVLQRVTGHWRFLKRKIVLDVADIQS